MRPASVLELGLRELSRRPLRSGLAVLGVALATATLVALVALARGIQLDVLERSSTPFVTLVQVLTDSPSPGVSPRAIDDRALADVRGVPHVREAIPVIVVPASLTVGERQTGGTVLGLTAPDRAPYALAAGRTPGDGEADTIVLTPAGLRAFGLAAADAVGRAATLTVRRGETRSEHREVPVRVVGVSSDDIPGELAIVPLALADDALSWIATGESEAARDLRLARQAAGALLFGGGAVAPSIADSRYTAIWAFADAVNDVRGVARGIDELGFSTFSSTALAQTIDDAFRAVNAGLGAIAILALIIAALGVANAMLTTVSERTVEIGILKALGATDRDVHRLVLVHAAALGALGGLLGLGLGVIAAVVAGLGVRSVAGRDFTPAIDAALVLGAPAVAVAVSIVASWVPAARAARLVPADALRAE